MIQVQPGKTYKVHYTNHRGEFAVRFILVRGFSFGSTLYHHTPQLLIECEDTAKGVSRTFAARDVHKMEEVP